MSSSLFTSQTPVSGDGSDGGASGITTATSLVFSSPGSILGIRFYASATPGNTYTGEVWLPTTSDVIPSGTLLVSKVLLDSVGASSWNMILFDTPLVVLSNVLYRAALNNSGGRYVSSTSFFGVELTNGPITAPAEGTNPTGLGTLHQGTFALDSPAGTYPGGSFSSSCYFIDVLFEESLTDSSKFMSFFM